MITAKVELQATLAQCKLCNNRQAVYANPTVELEAGQELNKEYLPTRCNNCFSFDWVVVEPKTDMKPSAIIINIHAGS